MPKLYYVHHAMSEVEGAYGIDWFSNKAKAEAHRRWLLDQCGDGDDVGEVESIEYNLTAKGVLQLLRIFTP